MPSATTSQSGLNTTYKPEVVVSVGYSPEPDTVGSNISHVVLIVAYSTVIVVSVAGNGIVLLSAVTCRRMRTVTNYHFIVNLAGADLMMAVFCVPFTFIANWLVDRWPFGAATCPIVPYLQTIVVFISAFTLVGLVAKNGQWPRSRFILDSEVSNVRTCRNTLAKISRNSVWSSLNCSLCPDNEVSNAMKATWPRGHGLVAKNGLISCHDEHRA